VTHHRHAVLGLGTATLMQLPAQTEQRRVIDAAWDMGIRHFDTAPLYGLGRAELVLGQALHNRSEPHDIYTKVGLKPSRSAAFLAPVQRVGRALAQRSPAARRLMRRLPMAAPMRVGLTAESIHRSLSASLQRLGRNVVEGLLIHDRWGAEVTQEALDCLTVIRDEGVVGRVGAAGPFDKVASLVEVLPAMSVSQVPGGLLRPEQSRIAARVVTFGVLGAYVPRLASVLDSDGELRFWSEETLGLPLRSMDDIAVALLRLELGAADSDVVLVGTTSVQHLRSLGRAAQEEQRSPVPTDAAVAVLGVLANRYKTEVSGTAS
jgi:D-threo-aldose 1-dehydrogenase